MRCRFCDSELSIEMIDLINSPPSNSYLSKEKLEQPEPYFPLKVMVCSVCWLAQIDESVSHSEIFDKDYSYFSSYSKSWLSHCEKYVEMITKRLGLNENSLVLEIASNDGYLLEFFKKRGINCLGVEPTNSTAEICKQKGINTIVDFFGEKLATNISKQNGRMDLIIGNNVLAHVPNINDFVAGFSKVLAPDGVVTMEFPHLMKLIEFRQFDTIYHEHYSYLSLYTVSKIFEKHGLCVFDVEQLTTHGGSLRIYAGFVDSKQDQISKDVSSLIAEEKEFGLLNDETYRQFGDRVKSIKSDFVKFISDCSKANKKVIAYGAAAKGNTFLNYCGVKKDSIEYVVDASPYKVGRFLPGSHIPIVDEQRIKDSQPDYIVILPWNLKEEVMEQLSYVREWGCKFVIAVPELKVV